MDSTKNKKNDETDEAPFNGALDTLGRIDELINCVSQARVNQDIFVFRENLGELLIEGQGFLTKPQYKKAWGDWKKIEKLKLILHGDGSITFDEELFPALISFSSWLRLRLHKQKVTMAGSRSFPSDMKSKLKNRYGGFGG